MSVAIMSGSGLSQSPSPSPIPSSSSSSSTFASASSASATASISTVSPLLSKLVSMHSQGPIVCPGHSRPVPFIEFTHDTPDGYFLISSCLDNYAMMRDGLTGDWEGTFGQKDKSTGHKGAVWCARFNRDATKAATGSADFSAKIWDALSGDELHTFPHKHIVKSVAFTNDGNDLITCGHEKRVRIFNLGSLGSDPLLSDDQGTALSHLVCLPDTNLFSTAAQFTKDVKIWDRRTLKEAKRIQTDTNVTALNTSLDQSILAVANGKLVSFYNAADFSLLYSHQMPRDIDCVAVDNQTKKFVTGSSSELWVRLYDLKSGQELSVHKGHHGPARSLAFAPHGLTFASGSEDGTIRIWLPQSNVPNAKELAAAAAAANGNGNGNGNGSVNGNGNANGSNVAS